MMRAANDAKSLQVQKQSRPATTLTFDPSSVQEGTLRSDNRQVRSDFQAATPSSTAGGLSFDPSTGTAPLETDEGPSTSGGSIPFTPRSADTKFVGQMLRSDLAAEVCHLRTMSGHTHHTSRRQISGLHCLQMAAVGLFKGRRLVASGNRPDLDFFKVSPPCAFA